MEKILNALIRPGRFDMQVTVPRPDVKGRTEILKWYLNKIKFDQSVDPDITAQGRAGFSGAGEILRGPERRSVEIDNKNQTITACHESGQAVTAHYTQAAGPVSKATGTLRGQHWHMCPCCLRMTDGMKLGLSSLHKWVSVWDEWQGSLYLELTILQQELPVILIMQLK
ncbi:ATP-dependent zinc metalloprotease YME1L1 [Manis javanica]|nr:ATP-dependent zinc metalloprotease YME1L1 [Manis javanica]